MAYMVKKQAVSMSGTRANPGPHFKGYEYDIYEDGRRVVSGIISRALAIKFAAAEEMYKALEGLIGEKQVEMLIGKAVTVEEISE